MKANERLAREYVPTPREVHVHDGEWCVACLAQGGRDALEFATRREPLDVEMLARALRAQGLMEEPLPGISIDLWAEAIAAEYARLEVREAALAATPAEEERT